MPTRRNLLLSVSALATLAVAAPHQAHGSESISAVATFSILGDMVGRIGGEHVALTTLVGPDGDAHVYQPTPEAARAVAEAELLFVNGLEFEGWLERLSEAADFNGKSIVTTAGIELISYDGDDDHQEHDDHEDGHDDHDDHAEGDEHDAHADGEAHDDHADHDDHDKHDDHDDHAGHDHGEFDPHTWHDLDNALIYVDNITFALAEADPANAADYFANREAYVAELKALAAEVEEMMKTVPADRRIVVTSHDAFGYFGKAYGLEFKAPQGLSTESEASAKDIAALIEQIRDENISAVFVESISDNRLMEQIANETGATIGGTLFTGSLSTQDGLAPTYIDMIRHNAAVISQALGS